MSLDDFMSQPEDAKHLADLARRVRDRLEHAPGPYDDPSLDDEELLCALHMAEGHWGVYGVSALNVSPDPSSIPAVFLDPAWLVRDLRRLDRGMPWVEIDRAEWAAPRLRAALDLDLPTGVILHSLTAPVPFGAEPGDKTTHGSGRAGADGTLGPPVSWRGQDGFITAGHVTGARGTQITVTDTTGAPHSATVLERSLPGSFRPPPGTPTGAAIGDLDVAIVTVSGTKPSTLGLGGPGTAKPKDPATKTRGAGVSRSTTGEVNSFSPWIGGPRGFWSDCFGVFDPHRGTFADHGDSGAGVTAAGSVIGIVVAGARAWGAHPSARSQRPLAAMGELCDRNGHLADVGVHTRPRRCRRHRDRGAQRLPGVRLGRGYQPGGRRPCAPPTRSRPITLRGVRRAQTKLLVSLLGELVPSHP